MNGMSVKHFCNETLSKTNFPLGRIKVHLILSYLKTNKEVLNKLGLQSTKLMTVVRQRIVRFYGHVRRHESLQRIITEGMVNSKRGRGRKRCGWLGNVSRYAGMNINRCAEIATNREEWRTIVSNVVSDKEQW